MLFLRVLYIIKNRREMMIMPNIKPISDLRNYTEVLKEVSTNQPVYLTRNGRGAYAIVEVDELDRLKATIKLLAKLEEGEQPLLHLLSTSLFL